jgi:ferredoxin
MPGLDVDHIAQALDRLQSHPLAVNAAMCTRVRHRLSTCTRCADACPAGALSWEDGLQVDWEACTGCGICAAVCPSGALEAQSPSNAGLLLQVQQIVQERAAAKRDTQEQPWVAFACPHRLEASGGGAQVVAVPCLGRLDESLLVSTAAYGAQSVWLVDSACQGCPQAAGRVVAGAVQRRSNELLTAFGLSPCIAFRHDLPVYPAAGQTGGAREAGSGVSRRGMFKKLAQETARLGDVAADLRSDVHDTTPTPAVPKGQLPAATSDKRLQLLAALKQLGRPAHPVLAGDDQGLFARFQLGPKCTGCQLCAFFCPTGALIKVQQDSKVGLAFQSSRCTACGLCRDICYRDAALLDYVVDLNGVLDLSVEWLFAQHMEAAPWNKPPDQRVAQRILGLS